MSLRRIHETRKAKHVTSPSCASLVRKMGSAFTSSVHWVIDVKTVHADDPVGKGEKGPSTKVSIVPRNGLRFLLRLLLK